MAETGQPGGKGRHRLSPRRVQEGQEVDPGRPPVQAPQRDRRYYSCRVTEPRDRSAGRPLAIDQQAESIDPGLPAFLTRPPGAPVYHGFLVIDGAEVDGFRLGMITDFLSEPALEGDAYVVAPDGSRAGLVWQSGCAPYFEEVLAPHEGRWGVWAVGLPLPMTTKREARSYLAALLPQLRIRWESWRDAGEGRRRDHDGSQGEQ